VVICETLNKEGGVGAMIYNLNRQSLVPLVYGVLFTIVLTGITQDFILRELDATFFPYKYEKLSLIRKFISIVKKIILVDKK